jgi:hypothetical protein
MANVSRLIFGAAIAAASIASTPHVRRRLNSSGSFATFAAILRASSRSNNFAADLRPGSSSK